MSEQLTNSFTDAPRLQHNLLTGSVRLLFWLFVHPSAWRNHLLRLDPSLSPTFSLLQLQWSQWKRWALWRFLIMTFLAWPPMVALLLFIALSLLDLSNDLIFLGIMLGIFVGLVVALAASIAGSVAVGVAIGIAAALGIGSGASLLINAAADVIIRGSSFSVETVLSALIGVTAGLAGGLAFGVGMGVTVDHAQENETYSLIRQVSGLVIGVSIGLGAGKLATAVTGAIAVALIVGVPFGLAVGWRNNSAWRGILAGLVLGGLAALAGSPNSANVGPLAFVTVFAFITALFALPYVLAEKIAGPWAGGLAGALGSGAGIFLFATNGAQFGPFVSFSIVGILLGLTFAWWRPVILYPLLMVWNMTLMRLDGRRLPDGRFPLLRYHSAFWDEFQRLPLVNLDTHLLLVIDHQLAVSRTAMAYLSATRQRWAAQAAQIELDGRQLANCANVQEIGLVNPGLAAGDLTGPASALLRSFSRISSDVAAALQQESAYNQRLALHAVEDRLDGLLRELTRSNELYAERFRPIAASWRQIVGEYGRKLAEESELRQEIDSPYIIGVPLTEKQEIFIGRTDVSSRIEQLLRDQRQPPLLLYGQRRVGKTSLLNNLGRLLPSTIVPMFVDLQGPASRAQDEIGFLVNMGRGMARSAKRQRGVVFPDLTREMLQTDPFTHFEDWLDSVEQALQGQVGLLMLDEFEVLERVLDNGRFDEEIILGMFRHLIQHRPQFKVLLSGSHTLQEFHRWSSYLINVQVIHVGYLNEVEARQLIAAPVQDFALRYEPEAVQLALNLTQGHPFLVQLLCAEVVALKNEQPPAQRRLATVADVETAVPPALVHGSFFFADIRQNQADAVGTAVLYTIAQKGAWGVASLADLLAQTPDEAALQQALARLRQRELVEVTTDGSRFQVELVRRWFAANP
jgi:hypothetical protein